MMKNESIEPFFATLRAANPQPASELEYTNVFELLAAVLLSAQATDAGVNKATRRLFPIANTPAKMLALGVEGVTEYVKTIGLYRNKAKNLVETCRILVEQHGGEVPRSREALEALPGVGRKTANVVRSVAMGLPGLPVDTHVLRLSRLLGLTVDSDPVKVEKDLTAVLPPREWGAFSLRMILHGRRVCIARRPRCEDCVLNDFCPSSSIVGRRPKRGG